MTLAVRRIDDAAAFLATAGPFLERREAEHNLLLGVANAVRVTPDLYEGPASFFVVTDASDAVVLAALHTPPFNPAISLADDPEAVDVLADALAASGTAIGGLLGPSAEAARFAVRWQERTGATGRVQIAERIHRCAAVVPPARPASGRWRIVGPADRDLVAAWLAAFNAEAMPESAPVADPQTIADRWVAGEGRTGYVWEDGGTVVSFLGAGSETQTGVRIGPVYTPPEHRAHGYATSLTAAATQDQLDRGRRFVFLFTDLANPTSNRLYASIGYEPVCDVDQWAFTAR